MEEEIGRKTLLVLALVAIISSTGSIFLYVSTVQDTQVIDKPVEPVVESPSGNTTVSEVYEDTRPSVVSIYTYYGDSGSFGSGFVYDENKHIVTNSHVIAGADEIYIQYSDGSWSRAAVVGSDVYSDIAVLRADEVPEYVEPLPVTDTLPEQGTRVIALGTPQGLRGTVTSGVVSGLNRSMTTQQGFAIPDMVQIDAALNPGNSGGPVVTSSGHVIGVSRGKRGDNIGLAVSSRLTETVADSLIETGNHNHPYIGIRTLELNPKIADDRNLSYTTGLLVVQTVNGTPASGNLVGQNQTNSSGDIIVSVDGIEVSTNEELASYLMLRKSPGDSLRVTVLRDGERRNETITLGERPEIELPRYSGQNATNSYPGSKITNGTTEAKGFISSVS